MVPYTRTTTVTAAIFRNDFASSIHQLGWDTYRYLKDTRIGGGSQSAVLPSGKCRARR